MTVWNRRPSLRPSTCPKTPPRSFISQGKGQVETKSSLNVYHKIDGSVQDYSNSIGVTAILHWAIKIICNLVGLSYVFCLVNVNKKILIFTKYEVISVMWKSTSADYIDGSVQERCNSIANTLELHLSCTNPSIWLFLFLSTSNWQKSQYWYDAYTIFEALNIHGGGWGCEVSCGGHHRPRGKTTTGSVLDGAVFDIAQILAYLVHNMSRSQLYLGFGHFGWLPSFFSQ